MSSGLHVKHPLFLSYCDLKKKTRTPNFMKSRTVGAELFHADRETERQT